MGFKKFHSVRSALTASPTSDVVIDPGTVRKRKKKPSKKFREAFGHNRCPWEEELP